MYLLTILGGVWKIPCAIVLFLPGFLRLKEWAYAGAVFNYTGAAASHFPAGNAAKGNPLALVAIALTSWALRPPARSLAAPPAPTDRRVSEWLVATLVFIVLFIVSLIAIPKGSLPPEESRGRCCYHRLLTGLSDLAKILTIAIPQVIGARLFPCIMLPAGIGETSRTLWRILVGVNVQRWKVPLY
jgi:hypothetical protein